MGVIFGGISRYRCEAVGAFCAHIVAAASAGG